VFVFCLCRKASLALLRKMIHYVTPTLLDEICSQEGSSVNFGSQLVEVLSIVLDNEVPDI
jgi:E3 ubiquitin-protein ligase HECTD1